MKNSAGEELPKGVEEFINLYLVDNHVERRTSASANEHDCVKVLDIPKDVLRFVCTKQGTDLVRAIMHHRIPADVFAFVNTEQGVKIIRDILEMYKGLVKK